MTTRPGREKTRGSIDEVSAAPVGEVQLVWQPTNERWWSAVLTPLDGGEARAHFVGWSDDWDQTVPADHVHPLPPRMKNLKPGDEVMVDYQQEGWYEATLVEPVGRGGWMVRYMDGSGESEIAGKTIRARFDFRPPKPKGKRKATKATGKGRGKAR